MKPGRGILIMLILAALLSGADTAAQNLKLDLDRVPFSYRGSYFAISTLKNRIPQDTLYINHFIGLETRCVFKIIPLSGDLEPVKYSLDVEPSKVNMKSQSSELNICFETPKVIRLKGFKNGFKLVSDMIKYPIPMPDTNQFRILGKDRYDRFMITCLEGNAEIKKSGSDYEIIVTPDRESCELAIEEYISEWAPRQYEKSFEECVSSVKNDFESFAAKSPGTDSKYENEKNLALYLNWSCYVYPHGFMKRPGILMSKNWMNYIWSWDNCFNAIGLAAHYPDLAWDQIMVVLENQDELGILPDRFRDVFIHFGFTKPPVYGFAIEQLEKIGGVLNKERYAEVYPYLSKLTEFWLKYRDDNHNGLPEYHNGNDSGWDNATVFDMGFPVEGPDLSTFLVIQMDKLSEIALKLGKVSEAHEWKSRADELFRRMINEFWRDGKFIYRNSVTKKYIEDSRSLLPFIPIALGKRLPEDISKKLVADLKVSGLLTKFGPATENPSSPKYGYDSYWRGPVWAPSTFIIVEGLKQCGEDLLAEDVAQRYCDLCAQNGFAENFDAVTGKPFRDQAYTWTASVFLYFLNEYFSQN